MQQAPSQVSTSSPTAAPTQVRVSCLFFRVLFAGANACGCTQREDSLTSVVRGKKLAETLKLQAKTTQRNLYLINSPHQRPKQIRMDTRTRSTHIATSSDEYPFHDATSMGLAWAKIILSSHKALQLLALCAQDKQ